MKLVAATNNLKKLTELRAILEGFGIEVLSLRDVGFSADIEETGATFAENALLKARAAHDFCGLGAVADDSGLEVSVLGGAPGIYSARYGGESCQSDVERYELLLRSMEGKADRRARFVSAIACVLDDGTEFAAEGTCEGEILRAPAGDGGFGYDPVFFIPELGKTMAEITAEEKNRVSHRAKALGQFIRKLRAHGLAER